MQENKTIVKRKLRFRIVPKDWKWWHWFIPSRRKIRAYLKNVEDKIQAEVETDYKINKHKIEDHYLRLAAFGQCAGECGWKLGHGIQKLKSVQKAEGSAASDAR